MAKKSLESQVRGALIQQRTDELVRYVVENPNCGTMITEMVETLGDSVIESIVSSLGLDVDEEEMAEMRQEYRKEVLPQVQAQFDNPQQLRQLMEEQVKDQHLSYRQLKAKFGSVIKRLRETNKDADADEVIDEKALQSFEKSFKGILQYARTNDRIVRRLAAIAELEGLDVATQKDTRYRVTRELFPTPAAYRAHLTRRLEETREFFLQAQSSLMADGMAGQLMGRIICSNNKVFKKTI